MSLSFHSSNNYDRNVFVECLANNKFITSTEVSISIALYYTGFGNIKYDTIVVVLFTSFITNETIIYVTTSR